MFSGGYPDESYVMKLINMREYSQFGRVFGPLIYMYVGGILLMTFIGCMIQVQIKHNHPVEDIGDKKNENNVENKFTEKNLKDEEKKEEKNEEIKKNGEENVMQI